MTLLQRLRERFWFVPTVLCVLAAVLAEALVAVDQRVDETSVPDWLGLVVYRVGESGSRDLLGAIASSSLAVAGTTFSITMAVLALTASSYGPRLVRNFMTDRGNQTVLGVFVATFLYSLLVLRSIRVLGDAGSEPFVPHVAVNVAVLLAVLDVGVLVYFIHHISDSIQVSTMAGRVRAELIATVDRLYPSRAGQGTRHPDDDVAPADRDAGTAVLADRSGYVLGVDGDDLLAVAEDHDLVVVLEVRPGHHVVSGDRLMTAHRQASGPAAEDLLAPLRAAVEIGDSRTPVQDLDFAVQQLTELAVRALSPGTNDPYTAINAIDDLTVGLVHLVGAEQPSSWRRCADGTARLHAPSVDRATVVASVLEAVRWYATGWPAVVRRAVRLAGRVGAATGDADVHEALRRELGLLLQVFARAGHTDHDVRVVEAAIRTAVPGVVIPITGPGAPASP